MSADTMFIDPAELAVGDHCAVSVTASIEGTVARVWDDEGNRYLELVTPGRNKRVFHLNQLGGAVVMSRGNEKVGR